MTPPHNGAHGAVRLLTDSDALTGRVRRTVRLEATPDGKSVVLIDVDQRKPGTQREVRYEITPAELIAAIRAHGTELPGESRSDISKTGGDGTSMRPAEAREDEPSEVQRPSSPPEHTSP